MDDAAAPPRAAESVVRPSVLRTAGNPLIPIFIFRAYAVAAAAAAAAAAQSLISASAIGRFLHSQSKRLVRCLGLHLKEWHVLQCDFPRGKNMRKLMAGRKIFAANFILPLISEFGKTL